jgi:hypothetical protein
MSLLWRDRHHHAGETEAGDRANPPPLMDFLVRANVLNHAAFNPQVGGFKVAVGE